MMRISYAYSKRKSVWRAAKRTLSLFMSNLFI